MPEIMLVEDNEMNRELTKLLRSYLTLPAAFFL